MKRDAEIAFFPGIRSRDVGSSSTMVKRLVKMLRRRS